MPPRPDPEDTASLAPPGLLARSGDGEEAWRDGYVWARLGRYDHAWAWWELAEQALPLRVAGSRAGTLRELGLTDRAEQLDGVALDLPGEGWERAAVLVGRVADAVGRGDLAEAERRLATATIAVGRLPEDSVADRQRIRLGWVEAEVALLTGARLSGPLPRLARAAAPLGVPRPRRDRVVVPAVYHAGTVHHLAKGLLLRGVVDRDLAALACAAAVAPPALGWAVQLARADLGEPAAREAAAQRWLAVVPPPVLAAEVAATPTARRLAWPQPR